MGKNKREKFVEIEEEKANLKGDYGNLSMLMGLYFLQGIISGITSAIPILLQNRGASYKQQALFSIAQYPFSSEILKNSKLFLYFIEIFSVKVLWSPIVDC